MEWINGVLILIAFLLLWVFIKRFLPSYMNEKAKNLATKEDVAEITRKTEEVQYEFRKSLEEYSSDLKFKYDYYYKQYSELYTHLYAFVCQSEYLRRIYELHTGKKIQFDEVPFLTMGPKRIIREERTILFSSELSETTNREEMIENTVFSDYNATSLCKLIIEHGDLATPNLLKLAVSYRFAHYHSAGNVEVNNSELESVATEGAILLTKEIFRSIVKDFNFFRKELKMVYSEEELDTGMLIEKG